MKKVIVGILFFTTFLNGFAQNPKDEIRKTFTTYIGYAINQDFEKSMDFIIEDFFEIFPRDKMVTLMKQLYNNPSIEFKLEKPEILAIENIEKANDSYYSILEYSNLMKMKFVSQNNDETESEKKMRIGLVKMSLVKKFGADNVTHNETTNFFEIKVIKKVCCASKDGINNWKFVTVDEDKKYILKNFIPKKILDRI